MEAPGGYGKAYHRSLHDACKVRASVFDDGRNRVALVGIDAPGHPARHGPEGPRGRRGQDRHPGASILIGASHSHSSGPIVWIMPGEFDDCSPLVQRLAYKESTCVDPKYLARVEQALIDAICEANDRRVASRAGSARASSRRSPSTGGSG